MIPLGDIWVFSSTSISSTTSTLIGVSPASRSVRVALTMISSTSTISISRRTSTRISPSAGTTMETRWVAKPMREMLRRRGPAGREKRRVPPGPVVSRRVSTRTSASPGVPISALTVRMTLPLGVPWAASGKATSGMRRKSSRIERSMAGI